MTCYVLRFFCCFFFVQEFLQKPKDRYHNWGDKEKAAEYHIANKDALKEKTKNKYKSLSEEKKKK